MRETHGAPRTVKSQNLCVPFFEPRRNIVENLASDMSFERSRRSAIGVSARIHYTLGTTTLHTGVYKVTGPYICRAFYSFPLYITHEYHANGFHVHMRRRHAKRFYIFVPLFF